MAESNAKDVNSNKKTFTVFLSYQWKSQAKVRKLYHALSSFEFLDVFMDIYKIKAGSNLYSELATRIQAADLVLACVTRDYVKSKNCEREIIYADAFNKPIIPLYVEKIPIPELGSIGFILVRERYCNLYKNEDVFESLVYSDEFKDILDGIESVILANKLPDLVPLAKQRSLVEQLTIDDSDINESVIQFRNDKPIDDILDSKEKKVEVAAQPNIAAQNHQKIRPTTSTLKIRPVTSKEKPLPSVQPSTLQKQEKSLYFEIHPVIKELKFLLAPQSLLYPPGDHFNFNDKISKRGGEPYHPPVGWIRYGLNVKLAYRDVDKWCSMDGNPGEWAVVYHGFKMSPIKSLLFVKLMDKNSKFNPSLPPSKNLMYASNLDINKRSTGYNQQCGMGILASPRADLAQEHTAIFVVNDTKYKILLQCRADPTKIRIPKSEPNLRIINNPDHIRPYGILLKKI